jgi:hypothetical protein
MAKKIASRSKKVQAEIPVEVALTPMPVAADAATVAEAPAPSKPVRARKEKAERTPEEPRAQWKRRLDRWSKKAQAAGVDAKALMAEALAA